MPKLSESLCSEQIEFEKILCGCALFSPDRAREYCWLSPELFIDISLGKFWKAVSIDGQEPFDVASNLGILPELIEYGNQSGSVISQESYVNQITRYHYLRSRFADINGLVQLINQRDEQAVRLKFDEVSRNNPIHSANVFMPAQMDEEFREIINNPKPSINLGIAELDNGLGGLFTNEMSLWAGRPAMGKTSLLACIARNVALSEPVIFFSLEMNRIQLWARMACGMYGVPWKKVRSGNVDEETKENVKSASILLQSLYKDRLIVQDEVRTIPDFVQICTKYRPRLVIIDHLAEIDWHDQDAEQLKWFGLAAKQLRNLIARRLHCHVALIHQLSRKVEDRVNKRPIMSDLKWSGDLEQIADIVLMLYRDDMYYNTDVQKQDTVLLELLVTKYRQGDTMIIKLGYDLKRQWFDSPTIMFPENYNYNAMLPPVVQKPKYKERKDIE